MSAVYVLVEAQDMMQIVIWMNVEFVLAMEYQMMNVTVLEMCLIVLKPVVAVVPINVALAIVQRKVAQLKAPSAAL